MPRLLPTLLPTLLSGAAAVAAAAALALLPNRAHAQTTSLAREAHDARVASERAHLRRVGVWGLTGTAVGVALALAEDRETRPGRHAFGVQTAGWGIINTGIAAAGLAFGGRGEPPATGGEALSRESRWGQILVLNQGLNVGYMMAGGALVWAGGRGVERGPELRGHGAAVVVQGLGLFVLDGLAWLGHRGRMERFSEALDGVDIQGWARSDGGTGVVFRLPLGR